METAELRTLTTDACLRMHGRLWPNQIGFTKPGGWEICYSGQIGQWFAGRRLHNGRRRIAYRDTPEAALEAVRTPGQYVEEAD